MNILRNLIVFVIMYVQKTMKESVRITYNSGTTLINFHKVLV